MNFNKGVDTEGLLREISVLYSPSPQYIVANTPIFTLRYARLSRKRNEELMMLRNEYERENEREMNNVFY